MAELAPPKRILVLLDGIAEGRPALQRAVRLSRRTGATVSALRVIEPPRSQFFSGEAWQRQERLFSELQAEAEGDVEAMLDEIGDDDVEISSQVLSGRPHEEAIRAVLRDGCDLVVVGAEPGDASLDREAQHLLRKCPCPVWVERMGGEPVRKLMVAVDLEPEEQEIPALSAKLVELALQIAEAESASVHLAHAWTLYREESTRLLAGEAAAWLSREAGARHQLRLHALLRELELVDRDLEIHLENGRPEKVIPQLIDRHRIDLLVLGSVTRGSIPGLLIGSTAERLVHRLSCTLLAAKPDDFETSVTIDS